METVGTGKITQDEIKTLRSKANSWNKVFNHVKNISMYKDVLDGMSKDGNQGLAVSVTLFIDELMKCDCVPPLESCNKCKQ